MPGHFMSNDYITIFIHFLRKAHFIWPAYSFRCRSKTFHSLNKFNSFSIASFHFLANHLFACTHSLIELIHDPHFDSHNHSFHCALISYEIVVNVNFNFLVPSYSVQGIICNLLRSLHFTNFRYLSSFRTKSYIMP